MTPASFQSVFLIFLMSARRPELVGPERLMKLRRREGSPAAGIRSGEPFMVVRGVILTAQAARGPDQKPAHMEKHTDKQETFFW